MKIIKIVKDKLPIFNWCNMTEDSTLEQIVNMAHLPFAFHHIAIMPDCHFGYGVPIGSVLATKGVVIANAVGVDIGCGMCAVKTNINIKDIETTKLKEIMGRVREIIPVGKNRNKEEQDRKLIPVSIFLYPQDYKTYPVVSKEYVSALKQLGSLGSGNHFWEIQKDELDNMWIMIHSGSRNIGKRVADYHNKIAINLNNKWYSHVPEKYQLAFLPIDTNEGQSYIAEMKFCVDFALANRKLMMQKTLEAFSTALGLKIIDNNHFITETPYYENNNISIANELKVVKMINIAHNYATMENHYGQNVMVHRKGATRARLDEIGIIPGSQGTPSYITKGLGNEKSFHSCSHGAGRLMGRRKAIENLNLEAEVKALNDKGIIHSIRTAEQLDEAPSAYKNIEDVMLQQQDLVSIVHKLIPVAVIKG